MLGVAISYSYAERHYAECNYAGCHYAGCHYARCCVDDRRWHKLNLTLFILQGNISSLLWWRYDTQHNDAQHNDAQHNWLFATLSINNTQSNWLFATLSINNTQHNWLFATLSITTLCITISSAVMLSVVKLSVTLHFLLYKMSLCWVS
jgi:hypothetical protein